MKGIIVLLKKINKISLGSIDNKIMQLIDSIKTLEYGTSKDIVSETEDIKCKNITKQYKRINLDDVTKENIKNVI